MIDAKRLVAQYGYGSGHDALDVRVSKVKARGVAKPTFRQAMYSPLRESLIQAIQTEREATYATVIRAQIDHWQEIFENQAKSSTILAAVPLVDIARREDSITKYLNNRRDVAFAELRVGFSKPDSTPGEALSIDIASGKPRGLYPAEFNADAFRLSRAFTDAAGNVLYLMIPEFQIDRRRRRLELGGFAVISFPNTPATKWYLDEMRGDVAQALDSIRPSR